MDTTQVLVVGGIFLLLYLFNGPSSHRKTLPPGPKKLPLIGNLLDIPRTRAWLTYTVWSKVYGSDIIHLSAAGNSIVVLNSIEAASDLMEKKSSIYSSRPVLPMLHDLMGWKQAFSFAPYNAMWRSQRKIFTQAVNRADPTRFHPQQTSAAHELLRRLMNSEDFIHDLNHWAATMIMDITYGIQGDEADPYIETAIDAVESIARASAPGAYWVDYAPILKYVPEWLPGAGFKKKAREWFRLRCQMTERPYAVAKQKISSGVFTPSLVSLALEKCDDSQDVVLQEDLIKGAAVTSYGGGTDTVVAALTAFVLAVLQNPGIQVKAQRELDRVIGHAVLPSFSDEPSLPYITGIVREVLRHNPVTPLAIPHLLIEDDIYRGYHIPKGSVIIGNAWAILHDETMYPDPMTFNPDRYLDANGKLNPNVMDPAQASFGFGRRICPGRHVAIASIWLTVASILATYNIGNYNDKNGVEEAVNGEWVSGVTLLNHPLPFRCKFTPRSRKAEISIQATAN
ncbi:cytochrome P450 [Hysterangium stoloniferum]|nr:cytochrome P450 [Hysterangium stoloniferum]